MFKRILTGAGATGVIAATYLLGSVSLGNVFAQTPTTPSPAPAQTQSTPAPNEKSEPNEQAESAALVSQAKITADQAKSAALAQFPGATIKATELEDENGTVVYSVQLTDSAGKAQDVKVDATTGKFQQAQPDDAEGPETPGTGADND